MLRSWMTWLMDDRDDMVEIVRRFILDGQQLRENLKRRGDEVSDVDLIVLKSQLFLLELEASHIQTRRDMRPDIAA